MNQSIALRLSAWMRGEAPKDHGIAALAATLLGASLGAFVALVTYANDGTLGWCGVLGSITCAGVFGLVFVRHLVKSALGVDQRPMF